MSVMTLAIQLLITSRCRELRLGRAELVRRCGYKNVSKGLRRLEQLYAGNLEKAQSLVCALPGALELPPDVVQGALDESARQLAEAATRAAAEAETAWREAFKPHVYLLGTHTRPSQLLFFAITGGAERCPS